MSHTSKESEATIELAASRWIGRRDAGMTSAEEIELERWKASDPRHERAFARHEQTWRSFDLPLAAGHADAMMDALAASRVRGQRGKVRKLVAGVAAGAIAGLLWYQNGFLGRPDVSGVSLAAKAVVALPEKRTLPDGSVVELKRGAEIRVEFGAVSRRVILERGEAYFQVAKDPLAFVVSAQGIEVRAVGTAFSVLLEGQAVDVVVAEGLVSVERPSQRPPAGGIPATPQSVAATAQRLATVSAANRLVVDIAPTVTAPAAVVPVSPPELAERLAWRAARLEFTDTPLEAAVEYFNRYSTQSNGIRLAVDPKDAALARLEVSGYFRADNVDAFLVLIEQTLGLKADRQGGQIVVRRAP